MATVYEKRGVWYLSWREGEGALRRNRARPLPEAKSKKEAIVAKKLFEAGEARGEAPSVPGLITLGDVLAKFQASKAPTKAASTTRYYRTHAANFARLLDLDKPIASFSTEMVEAYRDARASESSAATANKEVVTLRSVWRWAHKRRHVQFLPVEAVEKLATQKEEKEPCTRDILACALWVARDQRLKGRRDRAATRMLFADALRVLWHTGMRIGEFCRLTVDDVRWSDRSWLIRSTKQKGGNRRRPIPREIQRIVERRLRESKTILFPSTIGTSAYNGLRQLRDEFANKFPSLRLAGFHSARHAYATRAEEVLEGRAISDLLGHSQVQQTEGYTHRSMDRLRSAQQKVARGPRGARG